MIPVLQLWTYGAFPFASHPVASFFYYWGTEELYTTTCSSNWLKWFKWLSFPGPSIRDYIFSLHNVREHCKMWKSAGVCLKSRSEPRTNYYWKLLAASAGALEHLWTLCPAACFELHAQLRNNTDHVERIKIRKKSNLLCVWRWNRKFFFHVISIEGSHSVRSGCIDRAEGLRKLHTLLKLKWALLQTLLTVQYHRTGNMYIARIDQRNESMHIRTRARVQETTHLP